MKKCFYYGKESRTYFCEAHKTIDDLKSVQSMGAKSHIFFSWWFKEENFGFRLLIYVTVPIFILFAIGIVLENKFGWFPINLLQGP